MTLIALAAVIVFGALVVLVRLHAKGTASPHFVLGILPLALALFVLPAPYMQWRLIQLFQRIAQTGEGGTTEVLQGATTILRVQGVGAVGFLVAMLAAGAAQFLATYGEPDLPGEPVPDGSGARWSGFSPAVLAPLGSLAVPVGALLWVARRTVIVVVTAADGRTPDQWPARLSSFGLNSTAEVSAYVASRSLAVVGGGSLLVHVVLVTALAAITAVLSRRRAPGWLEPYSWAVLALAVMVSGLYLARLASDLAWFAQVGK